MKAVLEFNLPEEKEEFHYAVNAVAYIGALQELDNHLRGRLKYEELPEEVHDALQSVRDFLHNEACADFNIWDRGK